MNYELTKRHYDALNKLHEECEYEDSRNDGELVFVPRNKLSPGIGAKTLSDIESLGLIEAGINKWFGAPGYRITEIGRRELEARPLKRPKPKARRTLQPLSSRLKSAKGRLDR